MEKELIELINQPQFEKYNRAFDELGFGLRTKAIVLAQVYPIEKFGRFNRLTGKFSYKKSLAAFKQRLGYGGEQADSGDKQQQKSSGSALTRKALFLYVLTVLSPEKARPNTAVCANLVDFYQTRMEKFNYQEWVTSQVRSSRLRLLDELYVRLQSSMDISAFSVVALELKKQRSLIEFEEIDISSIKDKPGLFESRKGYGRLTLSHTAARAVKVLFRLLTQVRD